MDSGGVSYLEQLNANDSEHELEKTRHQDNISDRLHGDNDALDHVLFRSIQIDVDCECLWPSWSHGNIYVFDWLCVKSKRKEKIINC